MTPSACTVAVVRRVVVGNQLDAGRVVVGIPLKSVFERSHLIDAEFASFPGLVVDGGRLGGGREGEDER